MAIWHDDPDLKERFYSEYPDDLLVLVHEGSFRFTNTKPEAMWSRIIARMEWDLRGGETIYAYKAILLNQPQNLKTLKVGQEILLVAHKAYQYPIRVTYDYLAERHQYDITPCNQCGLPELFDPIPKLIEHTFPDMNKQMGNKEFAVPVFSSFCPVCRGVMIVSGKRADTPENPD